MVHQSLIPNRVQESLSQVLLNQVTDLVTIMVVIMAETTTVIIMVTTDTKAITGTTIVLNFPGGGLTTALRCKTLAPVITST
ncbi:MAG TPA: hypothetical protein DDZ90_24305, partial [Planctomycetaceae bacterium]|nr:hypothetical protein [Planctomycetaceae bacterium]